MVVGSGGVGGLEHCVPIVFNGKAAYLRQDGNIVWDDRGQGEGRFRERHPKTVETGDYDKMFSLMVWNTEQDRHKEEVEAVIRAAL